MDAYPPEYVAHNLPLVVVSGLGSIPELESIPAVHDVLPGRGATTISSELPQITGERADQLLEEFLNSDGRDAPWNGRPGSRRGGLIGFRLRAVGRVGQAPALLRGLHLSTHRSLGLYTPPSKGRSSSGV